MCPTMQVSVDTIEYEGKKGADFKEAVLRVDGKDVLRFAVV